MIMRINNNLAEIAGWYGAIAIVSAYALVSFGAIRPDGMLFQLLNLTGALGIITISAVKNVTQSVVLNLFWAAIASMALINIVLTSL